MKISHFHKSRGDEVYFTKHIYRDMLEPKYDRVYGSAIFNFSAKRVQEFKAEFPGAIVGGTWNLGDMTTVEDLIGVHDGLDYSIYPGFTGSIGFTQRGCRLKCGFCVVPKKEGKNRGVATVERIWRGEPYPKHLHLLDNDFFGQPEWASVAGAIIDGGFKVCFNQGINVRLINDEACATLGRMQLRDDSFKSTRLYTAWDNLKDERIFFRGVDMLERHGVKPSWLMVYMLVGWDNTETWERVIYRFNRMVERGIRPYPMVYGGVPGRSKKLPMGGCNEPIAERTLGEFQRWVIRRSYKFIPFRDYDVNAKGHFNKHQLELLA